MNRKKKSAGFLVDGDLNVLEIRGRVTPLVELAAGSGVLNLGRMLRPALRKAIAEGLAEARKTGGAAVRKGIRDSLAGRVDVEIRPADAMRWEVSFQTHPERKRRTAAHHSLRETLAEVKRRQEVLAVQLDAANVDLRRTHRELDESRAALRERYEFITAVLDTVGALIVVMDAEGRIVEFNRASERASGLSAEAVRGQLVWSLVDPGELAAVQGVFRELREGATANSYENNWVSKGGRRRRIAWSNTTMRNEDRQVTYVIGTGIDITERERSIKALEASEAKFRAVIENASEAIIGVDVTGTIRIANPVAERVFGYADGELLGTELAKLVPGRFRARHTSEHRAYIEDPRAERMDSGKLFIGLRKDGSEVALEISLSKITIEEGTLAIAFVQDVTERAENRRRLQLLTRRLLTFQEEERRRIARDIHDDLTQTISVLGMKLGFLKQTVGAPVEKLLAEIEGARLHVDKLSDEVRALSHRLHPSILEYSGLIPALESLITDWEKLDGPSIHLHAGDLPENIPTAAATAIYRIAQEALRNAAKYSGAQNIDLRIERINGSIRMNILDDGQGFDLEGARDRSGLGLISMQERALGLGGHLHIDAAPGRGTRVEVEIPLIVPEEAAED